MNQRNDTPGGDNVERGRETNGGREHYSGGQGFDDADPRVHAGRESSGRARSASNMQSPQGQYERDSARGQQADDRERWHGGFERSPSYRSRQSESSRGQDQQRYEQRGGQGRSFSDQFRPVTEEWEAARGYGDGGENRSYGGGYERYGQQDRQEGRYGQSGWEGGWRGARPGSEGRYGRGSWGERRSGGEGRYAQGGWSEGRSGGEGHYGQSGWGEGRSGAEGGEYGHGVHGQGVWNEGRAGSEGRYAHSSTDQHRYGQGSWNQGRSGSEDRYGQSDWGEGRYRGESRYGQGGWSEAGYGGEDRYGQGGQGRYGGEGQYGPSGSRSGRGGQGRYGWEAGASQPNYGQRNYWSERPSWQDQYGFGRRSRGRENFPRHDYGRQHPSEQLFEREPFGHREATHYYGTGAPGWGGPGFTGGAFGYGDASRYDRRPIESEYSDESSVGYEGGYGRGYGRDYGRGARQYARGPKGYQRSDERLKEDISERLMEAYDIDSSEVTVDVQGAKVILQGTVPSRHMKHAIEDLVDACPGVQDIENKVRVASPNYQGSTPTGTWGATGTSATTGGTGTTSGTASSGSTTTRGGTQSGTGQTASSGTSTASSGTSSSSAGNSPNGNRTKQ